MQVSVGTVFKHDVVEIRSFYDLEKTEDVLMYQIFVDVDLCLKHLQTRPPKLLQLYHLYRISLVNVIDLYSLVNAAREALTQNLIRIVFVFTYYNLISLYHFFRWLG